MATDGKSDLLSPEQNEQPQRSAHTIRTTTKVPKWRQLLGIKQTPPDVSSRGDDSSIDEYDEAKVRPERWSMGVLNDKQTEEVPGKLEVLPFRTAASPLKTKRTLNT
jgi:hypothetical protein